MSIYKLEVLLPPDELLGFRREIPAGDDTEAIARADEFYDGLTTDPNVKLDRYVLYDGQRVVRERVGTKG